MQELEKKARIRSKRKTEREKNMAKMDEIAKENALAEKRKDEEEETKDQIEIDKADESSNEIEELATWKSVGWLMEDYR